MKHQVWRHWLFALIATVGIVLVQGCADTKSLCNYKAVATIEPLCYFTRQIAGGQWEVKTMVPKGFSPEEFMPTVKQMEELSEACCVVKAGKLGFETTSLADVTSGVNGLYVCDTSEGVSSSAFDPHTWTSPSNAKIICHNIARMFITLDSAGVQGYTKRLAHMEHTIDSLQVRLQRLLADLPSRSFVIMHPALSTFATEFHLNQIAVEHECKEPTPQDIKNLIRTAKAQGVRVIFVQQEFSDSSARVLAQETGAEIVKINPLAYDWPGQLLHIAKSLKHGHQTNFD